METASLSFGEPSWFAALAILPVITLLLWWANRRNKLLLQQVVALRLFDQLVGSISRRQQSIRTALLLGSLALLIITLARPRLGASPIKTLQEGRDIIVAVDISRSMLAVDSAPNRLTHAKFFVQDFADFLQGDRLGLITFSGIAFLQIPLTTDYAAVANGVKELDTNFIPRGGTNIASAIRVARKTFGHFSGVVRALILVSDGEELEGRAVIEAKRAASQGIRIYTVGIGTTGGSLLPIAAARAGEQDLVRSTDGKPVTSYLDAAHLKEIAETTGGFYCPFKPFSSAQRIFHKGILPSLVAREGQASISSRPVERFEWTLIPAILLLSTWWLTGNRKGNVFQGRPTILFLDLVLLAVLSTVTSINAAQNGLESYRRGDYQKALKDFESYLQKRPNLAEASFDAGTAAYKLGDYDKALNFFGKAILGKSVQLRVSAQYNMGNSLVRKGEASPSDDQKRAQWKAAIQQYDQVLRQKPKNRAAADNRQLVQKMLKEQEQKETRQEQKETRQEQNLHSGVSPALFSIASKSDRNEKAGGREKSFSHRKTVPSVSLTKEQANVLIDSMKEDEQHFEVHGQDFSQDIYRNW
ncbi:von Willebrand factor type A domain protein [Candidatus Xiphinematobacter sp. Idaho Grape]|uniref:vWA domain-containing protein n=1 Tax=Candidatus Xiphinematobacter sp. Idaho Grape TaxID=1704307 RepID=UPI0007069C4E|nr:VWA domain-containing protein [Candidatus Xiphinematobacter sp. Idaho Grape]ALJ56432.1 von Willebrand factor type A domain protein [Candidatus Xiphinematobacter sp. Idaho Grape]